MPWFVTLLFGVFLIAHGLIHLLWIVPRPDDPKWPFDLTRSPMLGGKPMGRGFRIAMTALVFIAVVEFALAGLGAMGLPMLATAWRILAIIGVLDSLLLIILLWNRQFVVGAALNLAILLAAVAGWPRP